MSAGVPSRPHGSAAPAAARAASPNDSCSPGVSIQPGSITFTLMRCGVNSLAIVKAR